MKIFGLAPVSKGDLAGKLDPRRQSMAFTWPKSFRRFIWQILREEFLVPLKLTPYAVAAALHVPRTRIERIAREEKPVTADTALRLGRFFNTGVAFWMNIQARFDLETAEDALAPQIRKIVAYQAA